MKTDNLQRSVEAADLLKRTLVKLVATEQGSHAETIVAASARMAGTMLLRGVLPAVPTLEPGSRVRCSAASEQGPVLMHTMFAMLRQLGHRDIDEIGFGGRRDTTAASRLSLLETQEILEPWYQRIAELAELSPIDVAGSAAMATALLIHEVRAELDVHAACSIAVHGMVESIKTAPVGPCAA